MVLAMGFPMWFWFYWGPGFGGIGGFLMFFIIMMLVKGLMGYGRWGGGGYRGYGGRRYYQGPRSPWGNPYQGQQTPPNMRGYDDTDAARQANANRQSGPGSYPTYGSPNPPTQGSYGYPNYGNVPDEGVKTVRTDAGAGTIRVDTPANAGEPTRPIDAANLPDDIRARIQPPDDNS
jgi:hypothetical protein